MVEKYGLEDLPDWANKLYAESQDKADNLAWATFNDFLADYGLENVLNRNDFYIDVKIKEGRTLLSTLIIGSQKLSYVEKLINAGANLDILDDKETSALFYAVAQQNKEAVKSLLAAGANPNQDSERKFLPISMAVFTGNIEITRMLLNAGANPNLKSGLDDGPLFLTVFPKASGNRSNDLRIAELLIEEGAIFYNKNKHNETLMDLAKANNRLEMIEFFSTKGLNR